MNMHIIANIHYDTGPRWHVAHSNAVATYAASLGDGAAASSLEALAGSTLLDLPTWLVDVASRDGVNDVVCKLLLPSLGWR